MAIILNRNFFILQRMILDIILADTSVEDEDFYINDALVSMGYAVLTSQVNSDVSFSELDTSRSSDITDSASPISNGIEHKLPIPKTNRSSNQMVATPLRRENELPPTPVKKTRLTPKEINAILMSGGK